MACLVWRLDPPLRSLSTASVGGGIGARNWVVNAQVGRDYDRRDVEAHVAELAAALDLRGPGVGMLTAADLTGSLAVAEEGDVRVEVTVGLALPVWAAAKDDDAAVSVAGAVRPGTVNVVAYVPVRHSDAALANLLCTVTEAKVQALHDGGVEGTGTASDAVTVLCPVTGPVEPFGGPRSTFGVPMARGVYAALRSGIGRAGE